MSLIILLFLFFLKSKISFFKKKTYIATETVPTGWTEPEPEPETEETHWSEHTHSDHATDTATTSPLNSSSSGGTASTVVLSVVIAVILIVSMGAGFWVMKRKRLNTPEAQRLLS